MFGWWRSWKRKRILQTPATREERELALQGAWQWNRTPPQVFEEALKWMRIFLQETNFEGCGGHALTVEDKWMVASQAALMTVAYPDFYFDHIGSILIYPYSYVAKGKIQDVGSGVSLHGESYREGEAWYRGPVILNWHEVKRAKQDDNEGHHLVVHEFAHQMDMWNDPQADGVPPLPSHVDSDLWKRRLEGEWKEASRVVSSGYSILLNEYSLVSMAEFFAVSSEYYFQMPGELAHYHPGVFELLLDFYRVDWRKWLVDR